MGINLLVHLQFAKICTVHLCLTAKGNRHNRGKTPFCLVPSLLYAWLLLVSGKDRQDKAKQRHKSREHRLAKLSIATYTHKVAHRDSIAVQAMCMGRGSGMHTYPPNVFYLCCYCRPPSRSSSVPRIRVVCAPTTTTITTTSNALAATSQKPKSRPRTIKVFRSVKKKTHSGYSRESQVKGCEPVCRKYLPLDQEDDNNEGSTELLAKPTRL